MTAVALRCMLIFVIAMQPLAALASGWDIDALMQALAAGTPERARFVEKKTLAMLERPVESSGELSYRAPDRLEKKTFRPKPENMLVEGDTVTIERGTRRHVLRLQDHPELAGLVDSIRATLAGDRQTLERSFTLALEGDSRSWTLSLLPSEEKAANLIRTIRISGSAGMVRSIGLEQRDGDSSVMTIEPIASR